MRWTTKSYRATTAGARASRRSCSRRRRPRAIFTSNTPRGDDYLQKPAQIRNDYEPVDSSAAAIAAQGFLRMGHYLETKGGTLSGERYFHAGLTILDTLFAEPYLNITGDRHQGLILHSTYHRPNGWDRVPAGSKIPFGESSMWGDYHAREAALYVQRLIRGEPYHTFFGPGG